MRGPAAGAGGYVVGGVADPGSGGAGVPCLDDISRAVFLRVLARGETDPAAVSDDLALPGDQVEAAIETLVELRLLQRREGSGRLRPVDPRVAASEVATAFERQVRSSRSAVNRTLECLRLLADDYDVAVAAGTAPPPAQGLEIIDDPAAVCQRLADEADRCSQEALTVQPGGARSPSALADALPRDVKLLERGARMRILYQHTARVNLTTQSYVRAVIDAGAEVRTLGELTDRMIVFDRRTAFVPIRSEGAGPPGAVVVTEPHLVRFLCSVYERMWHEAIPFQAAATGYRESSSELRRSLLRSLAEGAKDEVIARRLGMSVRTCRRHIAELLQALDATSRFQAGAAAARIGWLDHLPPDEEP